MAAHVERPSCASGFFRVDVCKQDALFAMQWTCGNRSGRLDDDGAAIVDPFLRAEEPIAFGKLGWNIAALQCRGRADYPCPRFPRDVPQGSDPSLSAIPSRIDVNFHALGIERVTRQLTEPSPGDTVQFGSRVTFRRTDGRKQSYRIVGVDEADPAQGTLSYISPVAQALLGREVGDEVQIGGARAEIIDVN